MIWIRDRHSIIGKSYHSLSTSKLAIGFIQLPMQAGLIYIYHHDTVTVFT